MMPETWDGEDNEVTPEEQEQDRRAGLNIIRLARGAFAAGESILGQLESFIMEGEAAHTAYQAAVTKLAAFKEALELLHYETQRGRKK